MSASATDSNQLTFLCVLCTLNLLTQMFTTAKVNIPSRRVVNMAFILTVPRLTSMFMEHRLNFLALQVNTNKVLSQSFD